MLGNVLQLMACEELQVNEHLVVTASSGVYLLSNVAEFAGQHELHLRVDVLHVRFYLELSSSQIL